MTNTEIGSRKTQSQPAAVKERSRIRVVLLCIGSLLACLVIACGALVVMYEKGQRARLAARLQKLSAEGVPVDDLSLARAYNDRTSTESLAQWAKVFALAKELGDPAAQPPEDAKTVMTRLAPFRAEVTKATQSQLPGRFIDKFESLNTLLPHPGQFRSTADLLAVHAKAAVDASEFELAIQDCKLLQGCSDAIASDPALISILASMKFQRQALSIYRECIEKDFLTEEQLTVVLQTCRKRGPIGDQWYLGIAGERAMALAMMTDANYSESLSVHDPYFHWSGIKGRGANNLADYFESIEAVPVDNLKRMYEELIRVERDWDIVFRKDTLATFENRLATELRVNYRRAGIEFIKLSLRYRLTAIAAALRLYQKKHGEFPQTLEQLEEFGIQRSEFLTLADAVFDFERSAARARVFDGDKSWQLIVTSDSPVGEGEWEWTLLAK